MSVKKAKVFTVTSVKGGTGKTAFTINLAGTFSKNNYKTLIIDLDVYGGSIAMSLNTECQKNLFSIIDDMNNNRFTFIEDYVYSYNNNIDVLAAPIDPRLAAKININYLSVLLRKAKMKYQVVIIDTCSMLSDLNLVAYDNSDEILYIINNSPADLKNIKSIISIFKDMDKENYKIILNEATNRKKEYFSKFDIKGIIKDNIDYIVPESFFIKGFDKFCIEGKIPILEKKIKSQNKKTVNIFDKIVNSLIEEKKGDE